MELEAYIDGSAELMRAREEQIGTIALRACAEWIETVLAASVVLAMLVTLHVLGTGMWHIWRRYEYNKKGAGNEKRMY